MTKSTFKKMKNNNNKTNKQTNKKTPTKQVVTWSVHSTHKWIHLFWPNIISQQKNHDQHLDTLAPQIQSFFFLVLSAIIKDVQEIRARKRRKYLFKTLPSILADAAVRVWLLESTITNKHWTHFNVKILSHQWKIARFRLNINIVCRGIGFLLWR